MKKYLKGLLNVLLRGFLFLKSKIVSIIPTLRAKLIIMLIAISLLPVMLTGFSSYFTSKNVINKKLETTSIQTIEEIIRGLDNYFGAISNLVNIIVNDPHVKNVDNVISFEDAKGFLANINANDGDISDAFIGTETGLFYTASEAVTPADFDVRKTLWYKEAINNPDKIIITDPYISPTIDKVVVTIASVVKNENKLIGVVGVDINLSVISESLSEIKIGDSGYVFITDKNGKVIAHPDGSLIGTSRPTALPFWREAKEKESGYSAYEFVGEQRFSTYATSAVTGWKVISSMNYSELQNDTKTIKYSLVIILVILVIIATIVSIFFSRPISRNINTLMAAYQRVAGGDLTASVNIKSKDEFNLLGKNFNDMVNNIADLIQNVNDASTTVLETSIVLANVAEETNTAVTEVTRAVDEVAQGATEQAQSASDGAASISDLAGKLTLIEESTKQMDGLSNSANNLTLRGLEQVENLMVKSDNTMQSTTKVTTLVNETNLSMKKINAISNTIEMITEQTTLLSLNASIEAARAGENGRGFAVVASEIRKLADQSKASTEQIKKVIEEINKKTILSVEAMKETEKNVKEQVVLVNQSQIVFKEIMEAVRILTEKVTDIKNSTYEIASKKEDIVSQIENISAISEEAASTTQEVTAASEQIAGTMVDITKYASDLQSLSENLQEKMNAFHLAEKTIINESEALDGPNDNTEERAATIMTVGKN